MSTTSWWLILSLLLRIEIDVTTALYKVLNLDHILFVYKLKAL